MLKSYVSRIEELERHISEFNSDKSDIFKEAKDNGFDVKALKAVIAYRRKDPAEREEHESLVATYLHAIEGKADAGTERATRARTNSSSVSIAAGTAAPAERPAVQVQPSAAPTPPVPYEFPDLPAGLDRRPQ